jgi:NAD(P)-dependent dehydrogenase (short-subunit alcohol dehydrogenase family)
MELRLSAKTVIVTVATANIGRAIALAFAGEGANVIVVVTGAELQECSCHDIA